MIEAVVLALALAMDVAVVSAARGLLGDRAEMIALPLVFGASHAGMAAGGWLLGAWGGSFVSSWDHWIASGLLTLIGARMVIDALRRPATAEPPAGSVGLYVLLALATSIDAFAAGVTLPFVPAPPWLSIVLLGSIVTASSLVAFATGRVLRGMRLGVLGGGILIGLGVKILVEHL